MSALSYGCQSCSTVDSFNGSLQGFQQVLGGNNNSMINQMIEDNNFNNNNNVGNDLIIKNNANNEIYNADLRQNNYSSNNYNNTMNNPVMNHNTYGNGNNMNQHPMNNNYGDVKIPQVVGTKPVPNKPKIVPTNNNIVHVKEPQNEKQIGWFVKVGLIFLIALSIHETIKYYINHSIKFNEGSPSLFVYYAIGCVVAFYLANNHIKFE